MNSLVNEAAAQKSKLAQENSRAEMRMPLLWLELETLPDSCVGTHSSQMMTLLSEPERQGDWGRTRGANGFTYSPVLLLT